MVVWIAASIVIDAAIIVIDAPWPLQPIPLRRRAEPYKGLLRKQLLGCRAGAATESRPYRAFHYGGRRELRHDGLERLPSAGAGHLAKVAAHPWNLLVRMGDQLGLHSWNY